MKFKIVLLGTEGTSSQNTGIHAIANETRRHGLETFCIDYIEHYDDETVKEVSDRINAITVDKPIIGINTNFAYEEENFHKIIEKLKPHTLIAGGLNRLFDWRDLTFEDLRGTSREDDVVKFCLDYFGMNKNVQKFDLTNLIHNYTDDDVYPDGVTVPFQISRHCIFNCTFCNAVESRGKRLNWRRVDLMIDQMEKAQKRYKTKRFTCTANTFNDYKDKCKEFLEALSSHSELSSIKFFTFLRFDMLMTQRELWPLYDKFISGTFFGLETLNDKDSVFIRKGSKEANRKRDILEVKDAIPNMVKAYGLIHGLPNSTEQETESTIRWLIENQAADMVALSPLTISDQNEDFHTSDLSINPEKFGYKVSVRRKDVERKMAIRISRTQLDWIRLSDNYTSAQAQDFVEKMFATYNMRPNSERDMQSKNKLKDGRNSQYFKDYISGLFKRMQYHENF